MHHVEKLCNILYVLLFGILLIVVMGSMFTWSFRMVWILPIFVALFIIYITKKKRILKEEWCSVLWYIVYGGVFGVFDRVFLFCVKWHHLGIGGRCWNRHQSMC